MRYAILSDIHSNIESLGAVLERIAPSDTVLCLGDVVGYGPNPNECVALIRERAATVVLGNHDVAAVDNYGIEHFNPAAREAMEWTKSVLEEDHVRWLDSLAYEAREPEFLLVHGAPVDYFTYILDKRTASRAFAATDAPLIFVGHSHIAEYYAQEPGGRIEHRHQQHGGVLELDAERRFIVNVGSVGQPRDLNPEASFAFYDDVARTVVWERVPYAFERTQEKIDAAALPAALGKRLQVGR